jgi:hypothetical protein
MPPPCCDEAIQVANLPEPILRRERKNAWDVVENLPIKYDLRCDSRIEFESGRVEQLCHGRDCRTRQPQLDPRDDGLRSPGTLGQSALGKSGRVSRVLKDGRERGFPSMGSAHARMIP